MILQVARTKFHESRDSLRASIDFLMGKLSFYCRLHMGDFIDDGSLMRLF